MKTANERAWTYVEVVDREGITREDAEKLEVVAHRVLCEIKEGKHARTLGAALARYLRMPETNGERPDNDKLAYFAVLDTIEGSASFRSAFKRASGGQANAYVTLALR